jgi:hypothetical protein
MDNSVFFRTDQMELMAEFISGLIFHNVIFRSESDTHGIYIVIICKK